MVVSGKTKIVGIFGDPISHTLSPAMHNAAFKAMNLDICYIPFRVSPDSLADAVRAVRSLNLLGVNITVPHKEKVIASLDAVDEEASFIGAVNTIVNRDSILTGYNTDGRGFMSSLMEEGIDPRDKRILIIGTGGACRAISFYLCQHASRLFLFDIDRARAEKLAQDLSRIRETVTLLGRLEESGQPDIIVNATPLGLRPDDPLPIAPETLRPGMIACDLIYKKTRFLQEAESRGLKTVNGAGMLLWQGVLAFELWTGRKPPVDLMREKLLAGIT